MMCEYREKILRDLNNSIQESLKEYIGKPMSSEIVSGLRILLESYLKQIVCDSQNEIKLTCTSEDSKLIIRPGNQFTELLLRGFNASNIY